MRITVLYFAHLPERTGTREETTEVGGSATAGTLKRHLASVHAELGNALDGCRVAVDEEFAEDDTPLREGQTVAFIPPVSGG